MRANNRSKARVTVKADVVGTWTPTFLVAPSESELKKLGKSSSLPEKHGADVCWIDPVVGGLVGVQRKEVKDLIASVQDGRLAKEVGQLGSVKAAFLVVEGRMTWTAEGQLIEVARWTQWTRRQMGGLLRSVAARGIGVEYTDHAGHTVELVREIAAWCHKDNHDSLDRRAGPLKTGWGRTISNVAYASHLLQGIPGIGRWEITRESFSYGAMTCLRV